MQNYDHFPPNLDIIIYFKKVILQQSEREEFDWQAPIPRKEQENSVPVLLLGKVGGRQSNSKKGQP